MKGNKKRKLTILIITPFIISYLINLLISLGIIIDSSKMLSLMNIVLYIWGFVSIFFWIYVGAQFGKMNMPKAKSFILGNILWVISFLLYLWQFILLDDGKRNMLIAGISQNYNLGFVFISSRIISLFTNTIDGNLVAITSYLLMLLVFVIGFIYTSKDNHRKVDI